MWRRRRSGRGGGQARNDGRRCRSPESGVLSGVSRKGGGGDGGGQVGMTTDGAGREN